MHIAQVIPKLHAGGAEIGCLAVAKALIKQGHKATIITSEGRYLEQCYAHGIQVIKIPVASKNPAVLIKNAHLLRHLVKNHDIDLLHVRSRAPAWSVYLALKGSNTPWISTYHGAYGQQNKFKYFYNRVMIKADAVVAPSTFMKQHILKHYPECEPKLHAIPRGIDLQAFLETHSDRAILEWKHQQGLSGSTQIILLPGRLSALKGHAIALHAMHAIADTLRQNNAKLLILGDQSKTAYVEATKKLISQHHLDDLVHWMPHSTNMPLAYQASCITLNCSRQPESFGRTIVEAQASGSLIIASSHGGVLDNIIPEKTGLLFAPNDSPSLAKALIQALHMPNQTRQEIKSAAREHVQNHACETLMTQEVLALYQSTLAKQMMA